MYIFKSEIRSVSSVTDSLLYSFPNIDQSAMFLRLLIYQPTNMAKNAKSSSTPNKFANDGSFMEMFRKQMEKQKESLSTDDVAASTSSDIKDSDNANLPQNSESSDVGKKPSLPLVSTRTVDAKLRYIYVYCDRELEK